MTQQTDIFRGLEHIDPSPVVSPERVDYLDYFTNARLEILLEVGRQPGTITEITEAVGRYGRNMIHKSANLLGEVGVVGVVSSPPKKLGLSEDGEQVVADLKALPEDDIRQRLSKEKKQLKMIKNTKFLIIDTIINESQFTDDNGVSWFRKVSDDPGVLKELTLEVGSHFELRDRTKPAESTIQSSVDYLTEMGLLCKRSFPNWTVGPPQVLGNLGVSAIGKDWHMDVAKKYETKETIPMNPDDQIDHVLEMAFEIASSPGEDVDLGFVDITDLVCMPPQAFAECRKRVEAIHQKAVQQIAA